MDTNNWTKKSWRKYPITQQPEWPNKKYYENVLKKISKLPSLVFAGETRTLTKQLSDAANGKAFVLQGGDCSEEFDGCNGPRIHSLIKVILQMSLILKYAGGKQVVNIGRIAGQYAKPRSCAFDEVKGKKIPSYRGDMVNGPALNKDSRIPDPNRILEGYFRAASTLNLVRAFTSGGYAALEMVEDWDQDFKGIFPSNPRYEKLVKDIKKAIKFSNILGIETNASYINQSVLYSSHEALLLGYEEAMTRIDTTTNKWYDTSAHMLWIGDRTRQLNGAHVEFFRGVGNPIGIKIGPNHNIDEIKKIAQCLNPDNTPGKISLITRLGADNISNLLPPLVREFKREELNVVWLCDPMHGNTYLNKFSVKTRKFDDIISEIHQFFKIHKSEKTYAGGVHLELTGEKVTECIGGSCNLLDGDLHKNYKTHCDPRLNVEQAVELAFELADILAETTNDT